MRPLHIVMGLVLAAALGAALVPLPPPTQALVGARREDWSVPPLPSRQDGSARLAGILAAGYWGSAVQAAEAPPPPPEDTRWRIAAVFRAGSETGVLIEYGASGKPPQRLRLGDALPSGHRIVEVGERDVCVMVGKKKLRLGVERWNG